MKTKIFTVVFALVFLFFAVPAMAQQETLTNASVIAMVNAGLSQEIILAKIQSTSTNFDLTASGLVGLRRSNVPDTVIRFMLDVSRPKPQAGLTSKTYPSFAAALKALDGSVAIGEISSHDPYRNLNDQSGSYPNAAADVAYDQRRAIERERLKVARYGSYGRSYGRGGVYGPYGGQGQVAYQGPVYSDLDPAQVLAEEIGSELKFAISRLGGRVTTNSAAPYQLVARYSIADETVTQKGLDAGAIAYPALYARGYRYDVWTWLILTGAQIGKDEQRRQVQGVLYLDLVDREGNIIYSTRGSTEDGAGSLDSLESKNKRIGPYYSGKFRFPNAHFLAEKMVAAATAQ